jgi:hypothetical protein
VGALPDFDTYPWRNGWRLLDPDRPCYTCGGSPSGRFHDGSPSYSCRHEPIFEINPTINSHPLDVTITLTPSQIVRADQEFEKIEARRANQAPRFEHPDRVANRKYAIRAEIAVALATGLKWRGTDAQYRATILPTWARTSRSASTATRARASRSCGSGPTTT